MALDLRIMFSMLSLTELRTFPAVPHTMWTMTHHSLEQYVVPTTTRSVLQPARKMGRHASACSMLPWSMHALSCAAGGEGAGF